MNHSFNPKGYLDHVASELIANFAHAGKATTPSLVGGARETEVRRKLSALMPPIVSVGSGCVIDSYGNTSKQIDIIIYEKQICPVFSINDTPETTYFPCEGVVAIGEVKSSLNTKELEDSYEKIASVKKLTRHAEATDGLNGKLVAFRHYGNLTTFDPAPEKNLIRQLSILIRSMDLYSLVNSVSNPKRFVPARHQFSHHFHHRQFQIFLLSLTTA